MRPKAKSILAKFRTRGVALSKANVEIKRLENEMVRTNQINQWLDRDNKLLRDMLGSINVHEERMENLIILEFRVNPRCAVACADPEWRQQMYSRAINDLITKAARKAIKII